MDTIFAVSSGRPPAAIAVVRISGTEARNAALALTGGLPPPRHASLRALRDANGDLLDRALVLWFPGPDTATGEDVLELHVHGGRAVIAAVEAAVGALPAMGRAEPGEFTRRALTNGRIDLAQAAGLADLLAAESETQRRAALASAEGAVGHDVRLWLDRISEARAMIEAMIDYDEDGDVAVSFADVRGMIDRLVEDFDAALRRPGVERLRQGYRIVVAGPPNAGKSSLFNALLERDAAIVAPIAGTTRDRIEASVIRSGQVFSLSDTAGLAPETEDPIEREGIIRSNRAMDEADLILWLGDDGPPEPSRSLWVRSRCDETGRETLLPGQAMAVSVRVAPTIDALWLVLVDKTAAWIGGEEIYHLHESQRLAIADAGRRCRDAVSSTDPLLAAEALRLASRALGRILGIDETEAMLDALFARFCVGK